LSKSRFRDYYLVRSLFFEVSFNFLPLAKVSSPSVIDPVTLEESALTHASPSRALIKVVEVGLLSSRKDYDREIRRILKNREQWYIVDENVQATNLNSSATNQVICKLGFFREFFDYPKVILSCKWQAERFFRESCPEG
jgi:hypothetical protein